MVARLRKNTKNMAEMLHCWGIYAVFQLQGIRLVSVTVRRCAPVAYVRGAHTHGTNARTHLTSLAAVRVRIDQVVFGRAR